MNIRNPQSYVNSFWHWENFNDCFEGTHIRITDVDGLVERNGYFLLIETKSVGVEIPKGQAILFDAICKDRHWNVLIVYGETDKPRYWRLWRYDTVYKGGMEDLKDFIRRWFNYANNTPC